MSAEPRVRVVIVDDEPLARETLRLLMRDDAAIEIVAECASGLEAVETIARLAPDLVFLDIQMPELDGFQTLARLAARAGTAGGGAVNGGPASAGTAGMSSTRPIVVFVTAYDRYALKAFEAHALDYLVKPFTDERFHEALARAKADVRQRTFGALGERVLSLLRAQGLAVPESIAIASSATTAPATPPGAMTALPTATPLAPSVTPSVTPSTAPSIAKPAAMPAATAAAAEGAETTDVGMTTRVGIAAQTAANPASSRPLDRIAVKARGRVTFVRVADIDWIEACDDHIRLHAGAAAHELRQPLKELAARLDPRRFIRIHRSAIVNLDRVQELQPHFHGSYLVILKSGASLTLSRTRRDALRDALGGLLP